MDEEDLADAVEAQRLQTSGSFAGLGSTEDDRMRKDLLMDVFKAEGETMGIKLLRKMGWRDGQGVGPKVRRRARLGDEDDGDGERDEETRLFAPEDSTLITFTKKHDRKGVGYDGEVTLRATNGFSTADTHGEQDDEQLEFKPTPKSSKAKKPLNSSKGGFGVGILNDTGSDDEDPYEIGPRISYNKVIGGSKKKAQKPSKGSRPASNAANPLLGSKPVFISKKAVNVGTQKCHDGRPPLEGFVLSSNKDSLSSAINQDSRYSPPEIPKGWKSSKQASSSSTSAEYQSTADVAKASTLNPQSRASILGEAQLPGKSVFDFLSPVARNRIAAVSGKQDLPSGLGEAPPEGFSISAEKRQRELLSLVPHLEREVATKALGKGIGGWMPYAEDEPKRARYRAFLEHGAGLRSELSVREAGVSNEDWLKELQEFAHAAEIFKPMTGLMASRFTSSAAKLQPPSSETAKAPSQSPSTTSAVTDSLLRGPSHKPDDPAEAAARMGMYGPMTRSIQTFCPTRLLCKRFNVKPPEHVHVHDSDNERSATTAGGGGGRGGEAGDGSSRTTSGRSQPRNNDNVSTALPSKSLELVSRATMDDILRQAGTAPRDLRLERPLVEVEVAPEPDRNLALEGERPGDAVFKAIFGSDDDDDEE